MQCVVSVPGAEVTRPWWRGGKMCFGKICGWVSGGSPLAPPGDLPKAHFTTVDAVCIMEWLKKTFLTFPNWIESILISMILVPVFTGRYLPVLKAAMTITMLQLALKTSDLYPSCRHKLRAMMWSIRAGAVISAQDITRLLMCLYRWSPLSVCRRMDWFDGQAKDWISYYNRRAFGTFLLTFLLLLWFHLCEETLCWCQGCGALM